MVPTISSGGRNLLLDRTFKPGRSPTQLKKHIGCFSKQALNSGVFLNGQVPQPGAHGPGKIAAGSSRTPRDPRRTASPRDDLSNDIRRGFTFPSGWFVDSVLHVR